MNKYIRSIILSLITVCTVLLSTACTEKRRARTLHQRRWQSNRVRFTRSSNDLFFNCFAGK